MVSGGATPSAFSTSVQISRILSKALYQKPREGDCGRTAQAIKSELVNLIQGSRVLEIILDNIDVVGGGQQTRELGGL